MVAVVDETAERGQWMVGIVEGTKVGADNLVRSATVRISSPSKVTSAGKRIGEPIFRTRPVQKLILLLTK